jgi:hypothetical protein
MNAEVFFESPKERVQLFFTYHKAPHNYQKIKDKVAGTQAQEDWRQSQRGRLVFLVSVTIIAAISTVFIAFSGTVGSLVAIWIIWAATCVGFIVVSGISYKGAYRILLQNARFFERFEQVAQSAATPEEFDSKWIAANS